jgi:hypothetical protein
MVVDVNAAFGRNRRRDVLQEKVEQHPEQLDQEPDDEFKAACSQVCYYRCSSAAIKEAEGRVL